jgi:pyruvate kinase
MTNQTNLMRMRRTKIVTTLGPATDRPGELEKLLLAGANVVRLNFSHGTHEEHKQRIEDVRRIAKKHNLIIGVLGDLQGPKIRISSFKNGQITLQAGDTFVLDAEADPKSGTQEFVGIDYKELPQDVRSGDILLLNDGAVEFTVTKVEGSKIYCAVDVGGVLSNHKGINRKGGGLSATALTEKDKRDLAFVISMNVDYIAVSFPRDKRDMLESKALIAQHGGSAGVIAKIERVEAVHNIDEIIEVSDGIMVARGDLAVEIGDAEVPLVQKEIIEKSRRANKPVITATQMMESMIHEMVPTRAEVSDVANAVFDQTDAVMLSAESASGDHPHVVVRAMARACLGAERPSQYTRCVAKICHILQTDSIDHVIAMSAAYAGNHLNAQGILCLTESGSTPLWMSRMQTTIPIYGLSRNKASLGRMALYRGVYPILFDVTEYSFKSINKAVVEELLSTETLRLTDRVILTKGEKMGVGGGTNTLKIIAVNELIKKV